MKALTRFLVYALAIPVAFVVGGVGSFAVMLWWDSYVLHDHDGQAGIVYLIISFFIGIGSVVLAIAVIAWREWKREAECDPVSPRPEL